MAGLHTLNRTTLRPARRVGRGGKRGKTAGRGTKGQNARAGRKKRPELRDIIKKLPKRRGFGKNRARTVNPFRPKALPVPVSRLELFDTGTEITPEILVERGIVRVRAGKVPFVKIVGGTLSKKLTLRNIAVSAAARAAIEKAGGQVISLASPKKN